MINIKQILPDKSERQEIAKVLKSVGGELTGIFDYDKNKWIVWGKKTNKDKFFTKRRRK
jgi:hypothetical protein